MPIKLDKKRARFQGRSHRRSAWACDECRLRKRKCNGSQPCQPCIASDLACAYQSRRPAAPPTQRIRLLEQHLRQACSLIQDHAKHLPAVKSATLQPVLDILSFWSDQPSSPTAAGGEDDHGRDSVVTSMLAGCRRLISSPPWASYLYGPLSETAFILRILETFDRKGLQLQYALLSTTEIFDLPFPVTDDANNEATLSFAVLPAVPYSLPDIDDTLRLIGSLFDRSHPFLDFLHEQHFRDMVTILYHHSHTQRDACTRFLPLFHHVLALGYLFSHELHRERGCDPVVKNAVHHFQAGQRMLNTTQCDNLLSVQTLLCGAVFLISTSRMSRAHGLLSLASSGAVRMGLHCDVTTKHHVSPEERSIRVLLFTTLAKLDALVSLILDLPRLLPHSLVDTGVNSFYATFGHGSSQKLDPSMAVSIKHLELLTYTSATRRTIFTDAATGEAVDTVKLSRLATLEKDLYHWTEEISTLLARLTRQVHNSLVSCDLEMACNFAQLVLYRPFLPYLRIMARGKAIPLSQSRHALACIKLASKTILRLEATASANPDVSLSWDTTYTLFLAIMCLVFLISAHKGTSQPSEAWRQGATGIRILAANACVDNCAVACLKTLREIIRQLNHTVDFDFDQIQATANNSCAPKSSENCFTTSDFGPSDSSSGSAEEIGTAVGYGLSEGTRFSTALSPSSDGHLIDADEMLAHAEDLSLGIDFEDILNFGYDGNSDASVAAADTSN